jgi:hypothetical protein
MTTKDRLLELARARAEVRSHPHTASVELPKILRAHASGLAECERLLAGSEGSGWRGAVEVIAKKLRGEIP